MPQRYPPLMLDIELVHSGGNLSSQRREKGRCGGSKRAEVVQPILKAEKGIQYIKHQCLQHLYSRTEKRDRSE